MPERPALAVSDLTFDYGNRRALDGVTFSIAPGEATILLGPNGAGKTTLFSLISGLFAPQLGQIELDGADLVKSGARALAPLGIVFQAQTLDLDLTVRQNLRYFCALRGIARGEADRRIGTELERFSMADRLDDKVRALNGGHRRRVEIARALLHRPRILLLDEPTVGLDIPTRRDLISHLHARSRDDGIALLWATHLIDEVEAQDRVIVMHKGKVMADDRPDRLVTTTGATNLAEAFNRLTGAEAAA